MDTKRSLKIVTKGNVSVSLVNAIQMDMMHNYEEWFNKVTVRAKSLSLPLKMCMTGETAAMLEEKYQSWYDAEDILN